MENETEELELPFIAAYEFEGDKYKRAAESAKEFLESGNREKFIENLKELNKKTNG